MSLTLIHCQPHAERLAIWAARHDYATPQGDMGYALHALLRSAFSDDSPQPFAYLGERGLLGYTAASPAALQQLAALATPDVAATLGLDADAHSSGLSARAFPENWTSGQRLAFELRVRPIVRTRTRPGEEAKRNGYERDAYLYAIDQAQAAGEEAPSRDAVYLQWLAAQLAANDAAQLIDAQLQRFQRSEVVRQTQATAATPRERKSVEGPDASFSGQITITNPAAFAQLVQRGVGRHRAFGFGMLLLKPAR